MKLFNPANAGDLPLWLMDVDGVINCWPAPTFEQLLESQDWNDVEIDTVKIWWRRTLVDFVNTVAREKKVQPVWLTTWTFAAASRLAPALGLGDFPVVGNHEGDDALTENWWKLARVREIAQACSNAIVWTDDELTAELVATLSLPPQRLLAIAPASSPALTDDHLFAIAEFLRGAHG